MSCRSVWSLVVLGVWVVAVWSVCVRFLVLAYFCLVSADARVLIRVVRATPSRRCVWHPLFRVAMGYDVRGHGKVGPGPHLPYPAALCVCGRRAPRRRVLERAGVRVNMSCLRLR